MLQVVDIKSSRQATRADLDRLAGELYLSPLQRDVWRVFTNIFSVARAEIEAADALSEMPAAALPLVNSMPSLADRLGIQSQIFTLRQGATRRLQVAFESLQYSLNPQQRACAERHLAVLCRGMGCIA